MSNERQDDDGIDLLSLADLTPPERRIMRLMLRQVEASYAELCIAAAVFPRAERLDRDGLDAVLATLIAKHWLVRVRDYHQVLFRVNHGRRLRSSLDQRIWDAIDSTNEPRPTPPPRPRRPRTPIPWDKLTEPEAGNDEDNPHAA